MVTDWAITKLDEGPGWTREVLHRWTDQRAAADAVPGSAG